MKLIHILYDKETAEEANRLLNSLCTDQFKDCAMTSCPTQGKSKPVRAASKLLNDYAVTKLPFVTISTDIEGESVVYAAVYSEEGVITPERIKEKL